MATASREFPFFVLIETSKGNKFFSSYETQGEADVDAAAFNEREQAKPEGNERYRYYVVTKAEGDSIVPDRAVPEVS